MPPTRSLRLLHYQCIRSDLDAFDIELDCPDPVKLVDMLVALQPTFGGINLEDIKVCGVCWGGVAQLFSRLDGQVYVWLRATLG